MPFRSIVSRLPTRTVEVTNFPGPNCGSNILTVYTLPSSSPACTACRYSPHELHTSSGISNEYCDD